MNDEFMHNDGFDNMDDLGMDLGEEDKSDDGDTSDCTPAEQLEEEQEDSDGDTEDQSGSDNNDGEFDEHDEAAEEEEDEMNNLMPSEIQLDQIKVDLREEVILRRDTSRGV